jgi:hypothetical protein
MHTQTMPSFRRPSRWLANSEHARALADLTGFWLGLPCLLNGPSGDGHGVLTIPGFLADDSSTSLMRGVLESRGYRAEPWRLGRNLGPTSGVRGGLRRQLDELCDTTGRRVSVVGWSLGGLLARELARCYPDQVRQVVTMGSPLRLTARHDPSVSTVGYLYDSLRPLHTNFLDRVTPEMAQADLPVPLTSIYTRSDGVVPWRSCLVPPGPNSENVEVAASHCGMGFSYPALSVLLDRLAQPEGALKASIAAA